MIFFLGRSLSFFLTKEILIVFGSVLDTVKVKSGSLYAFINSFISSLTFFLNFKISESDTFELICNPVIPYLFLLLKKHSQSHFFLKSQL